MSTSELNCLTQLRVLMEIFVSSIKPQIIYTYTSLDDTFENINDEIITRTLKRMFLKLNIIIDNHHNLS